MKIKPEHYEILKTYILDALAVAEPTTDLDSRGLPSLRYRFDLFYNASFGQTKSKTSLPENFVSELYEYIDDSHIDTAIKKILLKHRKEQNV